VAAFKAQHPRAPSCPTAPRGKQCTPPQRIPARPVGAGATARGAEPKSFHSELEFSDSDSEL